MFTNCCYGQETVSVCNFVNFFLTYLVMATMRASNSHLHTQINVERKCLPSVAIDNSHTVLHVVYNEAPSLG